jgi:16S rRNA C967 or C1407 C5-methylase (RsmB/RsmF family)
MDDREDPIVAEIHQIREELLEKHGGMEGYARHLQQEREKNPERYVRRDPRPPVTYCNRLHQESHMTTLLEKAVAKASELPEAEQDAFAEWMLSELESENRWDALFARSQDLLSKLADEAHEDYQAGRTEPLDPDTL